MTSDDIVARLRQTHRVGCNCVGCEAADEIERLRAGGCAREQTTTQFCAEAVYLQRELDASRQRNRELVIRQGQLDAEVRNLRNALHDIADNKNNEPYAADHARDALRDAT